MKSHEIPHFIHFRHLSGFLHRNWDPHWRGAEDPPYTLRWCRHGSSETSAHTLGNLQIAIWPFFFRLVNGWITIIQPEFIRGFILMDNMGFIVRSHFIMGWNGIWYIYIYSGPIWTMRGTFIEYWESKMANSSLDGAQRRTIHRILGKFPESHVWLTKLVMTIVPQWWEIFYSL